MKKVFQLVVILCGIILLTGCSLEELTTIPDDPTEGRCPGGWVEDGKCCKADYTGVNVDANGDCPNASLPGNQIHHSTNNNSCYIVSCS